LLSFLNNNASIRPYAAGIILLWAIAFAIRIFAPSDLMDDDQERPCAYVMDVLQNGHWIVQQDDTGDITSKPPMLTWLAAVSSKALGHASRFSVALPNALAALATALLLLFVGRRYFGASASAVAAFFFLLSPVGFKQLALIRTDPLFTFTVFLAAVLAFHAWMNGRGWTWFWLAAAAATLTKGPLAVVLSLAGLAAGFWEHRGERPRISIPRMLWPSLPLYLILVFGWLTLAVWSMGRPILDKLLLRELLGHAVSEEGGFPGSHFYQSPAFFVMGFLPWSILTIIGLWRVWRKPSADLLTRRFERFLFCMFLIGLVIFSIPLHQRSVLILPLIPAAALLAGSEAARFIENFTARDRRLIVAACTAIMLAYEAVYYFTVRPSKPQVAETAGAIAIAKQLREQVGPGFPLIYLDSPYALQFYYQSMRTKQFRKTGLQAMQNGHDAFYAISNVDKFHKALDENSPAMTPLLRWPQTGEPQIAIFSNHPRLEYTPKMATFCGRILLQMENVKLVQARNNDLVIKLGKEKPNTVALQNTSDKQAIIFLRTMEQSQGDRIVLEANEKKEMGY